MRQVDKPSEDFTWGAVLLTVMMFAMFELSFIVPQYFQAIRGINLQGTGLLRRATESRAAQLSVTPGAQAANGVEV